MFPTFGIVDCDIEVSDVCVTIGVEKDVIRFDVTASRLSKPVEEAIRKFLTDE